MFQYLLKVKFPLFSHFYPRYLFSPIYSPMLSNSKNNHTGVWVDMGLDFSICFRRIDVYIILRPSRQEQDTYLFTQVLLSGLLGVIYLFFIYIYIEFSCELADSCQISSWYFILCWYYCCSLFSLCWLLFYKKATDFCIFIF